MVAWQWKACTGLSFQCYDLISFHVVFQTGTFTQGEGQQITIQRSSLLVNSSGLENSKIAYNFLRVL